MGGGCRDASPGLTWGASPGPHRITPGPSRGGCKKPVLLPLQPAAQEIGEAPGVGRGGVRLGCVWGVEGG